MNITILQSVLLITVVLLVPQVSFAKDSDERGCNIIDGKLDCGFIDGTITAPFDTWGCIKTPSRCFAVTPPPTLGLSGSTTPGQKGEQAIEVFQENLEGMNCKSLLDLEKQFDRLTTSGISLVQSLNAILSLAEDELGKTMYSDDNMGLLEGAKAYLCSTYESVREQREGLIECVPRGPGKPERCTTSDPTAKETRLWQQCDQADKNLTLTQVYLEAARRKKYAAQIELAKAKRSLRTLNSMLKAIKKEMAAKSCPK